MWFFTFRRWMCFYLLFCSYVQLLLANWKDFAAIVTVLLTRAVGFVGSAGPFRLCFAARAHQEGTLDPLRTGQSAAQVRDAPMIKKRSVWALWPWDCVMVKISLQWALNSVYWFWFSLLPFQWGNVRAKIIINPLNCFQMSHRAVSWTLDCICTESSQENHQEE